MKNLYDYFKRQSVLKIAWQAIRSNGLNSPSKETRDKILQYEINIDKYLNKIYRKLLSNKYKFSPAIGYLKERKKKTPRPIVVSTISDRIVQRAILDVLQNKYKAKHKHIDLTNFYNKIILNDSSFGGLLNKGVKDAINKIVHEINNKKIYYIKSDIKDFFPSIPKDKVIKIIRNMIPDNSLIKILEEAISVELENLKDIDKHKDLFPTYEIGVAQGCCLSPLLGNVLLYEFDNYLKTDKTTLIRYIDDFIILGENKNIVHKVFEKAQEVLFKNGLNCYNFEEKNTKAFCGYVNKSFEFLGCQISDGFIHPSKTSRNRIINKIKNILEESKKNFYIAKKYDITNYPNSFIESLSLVSKTLQAWGNQYSFCNSRQSFDSIDEKVDKLISTYFDVYMSINSKIKDTEKKRRILGVHRLNDCNKSPIIWK